MSTPTNPNLPSDEPVRPHTYDGIQEYDKKLPNWWLLTFYGAIAFAIVYWFYFAQTALAPKDGARIEAELARIQAVKLSSVSTMDDDALWQMSRNSTFVSAGETTYRTTCASCHAEKLTGGIGPSLVDQTWLHGGRPTDIYGTVTNGITTKGMPTWGPVLGAKKIAEVVAFVLSKHDPAEPGMTIGAVPGTPSAP